MNISIVLILLLAGAAFTFFAGNKFASKIALLVSVASFVFTLYALNLYLNGADLSCKSIWIQNPKIYFSLAVDGLSLAMLLLTTGLLPLIILSGWVTKFKNEILKFFIYTFGGSLFMLVAVVYLYQKAGSLEIESLYALTLTETEKTWLFLAFFLAYAIKIPLIPFHTLQANTYSKAPAIGTMLLSGIMLKMGLYSVLRWQLPITDTAAKEFMPYILGVSIAGVIYGAVLTLRQKNLKKLLAYSSLSHVGLIAAGLYSLTIEGFQGAVLQMLSHGLVIVGLFFVSEIIFNRWNTYTISEMGGIRSQATKFASFFMILVLASVAMPTTFNFVGEFTILYSLYNVNIGFAIVAGTTIILGAFYMLRMYQQTMLGETNTKVFADVTIVEGLVLLVIVGFVFFFGLYPKPIIELITPSLQNILNQIN